MSIRIADAVAYHEQLAPTWERRYRSRSFRSRELALSELLNFDLRTSTWLDAGCGTGVFSRWLALRGGSVLGFDASPKMLEHANQFTVEGSPGARIRFEHVETIERLPLKNASFDGVLCVSVLEYVSDPMLCLGEFARVLKTGGLLLVSVPNRQSFFRKVQRLHYRAGRRFACSWSEFMEYSRHEYIEADFVEQLARYGFITERVSRFGAPPIKWVQRQHWGGSLLMFMARKQSRQD